MRGRHPVLMLVATMVACRPPPPVRHPAEARDATAPYCQLAIAILDAAVRTYSDQPFGLEQSCVDARARAGRSIYVDARFSRKVDPDVVAQPDCASGPYLIRFNWKAFTPAPSPEVVLLLVYDEESGS